MSQYRLFLFEPVRRLGDRSARAREVVGVHDAHAIRAAEHRRGGQYAELWRGQRLVKIFEPD